MCGPVGHALPRLEFPSGNGPIVRTTGEHVGVGTPCEVGDTGLVLPEVEELAAVLRLPDHHVAVAVRGREEDTIRAEVSARYPFSVFGDRVEQFARGGVETLHLLSVCTDGDTFMVRADICGHQLVEFFTDLGDASAGLHIPDDGMAEFTTAATA